VWGALLETEKTNLMMIFNKKPSVLGAFFVSIFAKT